MIFEALANRISQTFPGPLSGPGEAVWSPDGKYWFGGGHLFDAHSGALLATAPYAYVREVVWKGDEIWTASLQRVTRWKIPTLQKIADWEIGPSKDSKDPGGGYHDGVRLSPDGTIVLTSDPKGVFGGGKPGLWVWDAATQKVLRTLIPDFEHGYSSLDQLVFFPSGDKIVRPTKTGMELWSLQTGAKIKEWHDPVDPKFQADTFGGGGVLMPLAVSPDEQLIAARATRDQTIWIFDMAGKAPLQLLIKAGYSAQFLRDGSTLLAQAAEGNYQEWNARGDGRAPLRSWSVKGGALRLSPDERFAAISAQGDPLIIWDRQKNGEAVRIYVAGSGRGPFAAAPTGWLALTPQGFYNASSEAEKRLRWRDANAFWPVEKSRAQFFRPDKVCAALQSDAPASDSH
jgi:WD40 repeat protein